MGHWRARKGGQNVFKIKIKLHIYANRTSNILLLYNQAIKQYKIAPFLLLHCLIRQSRNSLNVIVSVLSFSIAVIVSVLVLLFTSTMADGELCAKCRLPYDRYDRRPQLIQCETIGCKAKIHRQCHVRELSNTDYARMKKDHEKFGYKCGKCANTDESSPLPTPALSEQPAQTRGRGRPRRTQAQSQPLPATAPIGGQSIVATNVGRKRRGIFTLIHL